MRQRVLRNVAITLAALLLLTACGQSSQPAPQPAKTAPAAAPAAPATQAKAAAPAPAPAPAPAKINFPEKPIKVIVTHAAGGSTDIPGRLIQPYVEKILGQPVVLEIMAGAGGVLARNFVYKAKPDGYTLMQTQMPSLGMAPFIQKTEYELLKFTPIYSITGRDYLGTFVHKDAPWKTLKELLDDLPNKTLSVGGSAGSSLIVVALYRKFSGGKLRYVPFDTGSQSGSALAGKNLDIVVTNVSMLMPLVEQGLLRHLAVHGDDKHPGYPTLPTVKEMGRPDLVVDQLTGIWAPPGTPPEIAKVISDAYIQAGKDPKFMEDVKKAKLEPQPMNPTELMALMQRVNTQLAGMKDVLQEVQTAK